MLAPAIHAPAKRLDDQTLAATAVRCLACLAQRNRRRRIHDIIAAARDLAAAIETLVMPDTLRPARA